MLEFRGFAVGVAGRRLTEPVDRTIPSGTVLAVLGASGSGKTTALAAAAGLTRPMAGAVTLNGQSMHDVERTSVGVVSQPVVLSANLTVEENIGLSVMASAHRCLDDAREDAAELMRALLLDKLADRLPGQLSGGQRQRVATARAVIGWPPLIVADEPTSELDEANRVRVIDVLRLAASRGSIVVIATHDDEVARRCDAAWVLTPAEAIAAAAPSRR